MKKLIVGALLLGLLIPAVALAQDPPFPDYRAEEAQGQTLMNMVYPVYPCQNGMLGRVKDWTVFPGTPQMRLFRSVLVGIHGTNGAELIIEFPPTRGGTPIQGWLDKDADYKAEEYFPDVAELFKKYPHGCSFVGSEIGVPPGDMETPPPKHEIVLPPGVKEASFRRDTPSGFDSNAHPPYPDFRDPDDARYAMMLKQFPAFRCEDNAFGMLMIWGYKIAIPTEKRGFATYFVGIPGTPSKDIVIEYTRESMIPGQRAEFKQAWVDLDNDYIADGYFTTLAKLIAKYPDVCALRGSRIVPGTDRPGDDLIPLPGPAHPHNVPTIPNLHKPSLPGLFRI